MATSQSLVVGAIDFAHTAGADRSDDLAGAQASMACHWLAPLLKLTTDSLLRNEYDRAAERRPPPRTERLGEKAVLRAGAQTAP